MENIKIKKKKIISKKEIISFATCILIVMVSGFLSGANFKTFFEVFDIIPTGMSGLAMIVHNALYHVGVTNIPLSIIYFAMNIVLFAFSLKIFGWKFLVLSGLGMVSYTLGIEFGFVPALAEACKDEQLLAAIIGSIIAGLFTGITLKIGGSTGGSDIFGALISKVYPKIKTGMAILFFNVFVLVLSVITSGIKTGLYALLVSVLSSLATDFVLDSSKSAVAYHIICDKEKEITDAILKRFHRGVTKLNAQGSYSKNDKAMLLVLIPKIQAREMKKIVSQIDPKAFVFSSLVTETIDQKNFLEERTEFDSKITKSKPELKAKAKYLRKSDVKKLKINKKLKKFNFTNV